MTNRANDLAVYVPWASVFYGRDGRPEEPPVVGTGGDIQSIFLTRALTSRGLRVAHIIYAVDEVDAQLPPNLTLVQVATRPSARLRDKARRMREAWQAFKAADASVYFFRGTGAEVVVGGLYCALHRRQLLFSAASDFDFDLSRRDRSLLARLLYRLAIRRASLIVAQRDQQAELARRAVPPKRPLIVIPSFAEELPEAETEAEAFLWIGRLVDYKLPLEFVRLARELPEFRFRMVAVETNETSPELADRFAAETAELPNLEVLPMLSRDAVLELIRRAVAVVATSRAEGMPNIFLEAWGMGVPVLSLHFDPDGTIERELSGFGAAGSWERFRGGARRIGRDRELRGAMGARGREFVRARHNPETVGAKWAELISASAGCDRGGLAA